MTDGELIIKIYKVYRKLKYPIIKEENYINIIGVRSPKGQFNDMICTLEYIDKLPIIKKYRATTEPGMGWLNKKMGNKEGTFILKEGYYEDCWILGKHRGKYDALIQNYNRDSFIGYRDNNQDGDADASGKLYYDVSGLNLHSTKYGYFVNWIGNFSAGCQVIFSWNRYHKYFIPSIKKHFKYHPSINYGLINVTDLYED